MMRTRNQTAAVLLSTVIAVCLQGRVPSAQAQGQLLIERLFRTEVTSVTPVFAEGDEGNSDAIVGFRVESAVFEIQKSIEGGVIPPKKASDIKPLGRIVSELRFVGNGRIDKSKTMQILVGKAVFNTPGTRFTATGTSIIHWCKNDAGGYSGVRWTDFSGTITRIKGRHAGAKGHVVGTRLLVGDPELQRQSGLLILRLLR